MTWFQGGQWHHQKLFSTPGDSLQTLELTAVTWATSQWIDIPLNVVTDSLYVVGVVQRIEDSFIREIKNDRLLNLFQQLQRAVRQHLAPYCVIHIRSHKYQEGLAEGNARADKLVSLTRPILSQFEAARTAHAQFHQNAKGLRRQFRLTEAEATRIVRSCPQCSHHGPGLGLGVNP